jgi:predicted ATP-grasp superfamily ATP-dependent carboligase
MFYWKVTAEKSRRSLEESFPPHMTAMTTTSTKPTDVLVLGDRRQTLTVIRSLARAGYRITVGQSDRDRYGGWSRYCSKTWTHPAVEADGSRFIQSLNEFLRLNPHVTVLFPIGDTEIRILSRNRHCLPDQIQIVMPAREIVELCHDKIAMCRFAQEAGLPQPCYETAAAGQELAPVAERIGYPCVIRPHSQFVQWNNEKVIICRSPADAARLDANPDVREKDRMVQRYVNGLRHNLHFIAVGGVLQRYLETKTRRTDRPDGTGLTVDGVSVEPNPAIVEACKTLAARLNYTGLGSTQFLVDEAGVLTCFLENNPRLCATIALPCACGVNFPRLAVEQLLGHVPADGPPDQYRRGVRFGWLYGDIHGLFHALRTGQAGVGDIPRHALDMIRTFLSAQVHPTWSPFDPLPTCVNYARLIDSGVRKLLARLLKRGLARQASSAPFEALSVDCHAQGNQIPT